MAFQGLFEEEGKLKKLGEIKGIDVVGTKIKAPLSVYDQVWVLPMDGVLATKVSSSSLFLSLRKVASSSRTS